MNGRLLTLLTIAALLLPCRAEAQWYRDEISSLRNENRRLQAALDSVRRELSALKEDAVLDPWAMLEGIETDEAGFNRIGGHPNPDGTTNEDDRIMAARVRLAAPFLIIPWRPDVRRYVEFYGITKKRMMKAALSRFRDQETLIKREFDARGIPEDIRALCIVESAVSPKARSKAGALGMWQFMPETAREYGLEVNDLNDERTDIPLSTKAAAAYLSDAYRKFGRWDFAVLSYNCGAGRVRQAIIKAGKDAGFWDIYEYLPEETRGYLLSLIAVKYVMKNPDEFGL